MLILTFLVALILLILIVYIINTSYIRAVKKAQNDSIAALNEAAIAINTKNCIILFNTAAENITGVSVKDAIGQPIDKILRLSVEQTPVLYKTYSDSPEERHSSTLTLHNTNEAMTQIIVTIAKHAIGSDYTLITLMDTSKEKQLEEMKVDFVSMAAHELRTPLTAIRGYTSLLQMHYATQLDQSAKELLTRLIVSTTNLTNLIDNLLSVSRIERNSLIIEAKPLDLGIIIKDIFSSFEQQAHTKNQHFTLNLPDNLPQVMADPFRIGQVFINLISNALNYTPDGGTITVTVADRTDHLEVTVQDTGEGIPPEALPRLFTKFFRVSGSLEQGSKGTGLGLYITKSIVEMHKGKIWAQSTFGKGSTFIFTLPFATSEQKAQYEQHTSTNAFLTVKNGQGIIIKRNSGQVQTK
ncbi:MAG TPA: ATP-binding protein [Candidatus Sulfotelmatobacter sp.]|jgi:two-component system phosphate regulon sensor histidine kinase PhoR|nr:ATP-binding protein [Candidatus Sulfotelmatobacter sp.]